MLEALTASMAPIHKLKLSFLRRNTGEQCKRHLPHPPDAMVPIVQEVGEQFCLLSQTGINEAQMFWAKFYSQLNCSKHTITPLKTKELFQIWGLILSPQGTLKTASGKQLWIPQQIGVLK